MSITIEAHHGSPGTPKDFDALKSIAPELSINALAREDGLNGDIALGYSYGCVKALKKANRNSKCKALILVAPYLINEKGSQTLIKTILKTPLLGNKILAKKAESAVEELLQKSSFPSEIPESYKALKAELSAVDVLKNAVLEKTETEEEILKEIDWYHESERPVLVIAGAEDQTSSKEKHLKPLERIQNSDFKIILEAGHALPWTHSKEISNHINSFLQTLGV